MRSMLPRKRASVFVRAVLMPRSFWKFRLQRFFRMNPRLAHLFMICSNIKLIGPAESIGIGVELIHERNQRDLGMDVQRKLEILADAAKYHPSCASTGTHHRDSTHRQRPVS